VEEKAVRVHSNAASAPVEQERSGWTWRDEDEVTPLVEFYLDLHPNNDLVLEVFTCEPL
jgi:hypothetical protein